MKTAGACPLIVINGETKVGALLCLTNIRMTSPRQSVPHINGLLVPFFGEAT